MAIATLLIRIILITASVGAFYGDLKDLHKKCTFWLKCSEPTVVVWWYVLNKTNLAQSMRFPHTPNCSGLWFRYSHVIDEENVTVSFKESHKIAKIIKTFNHVANMVTTKIKSDSNEPVWFKSHYFKHHKWEPPCHVICAANCTKDDENSKGSSEEIYPTSILLLSICMGLAVNYF